ncbi:hypothetical protein Ancab_024562 [Ancistrocladus abbreviatus]
MEKIEIPICVFLLIQVALVYGVHIHQANIWPMPNFVSYGDKIRFISNAFELKTEGSKFGDASGILKDGFSRLMDIVKLDHVIDANLSLFEQSAVLGGINVAIASPSSELQHGVDESYKSIVPSPREQAYARLEAPTVYGALHGLQTFSQLCHFNYRTRAIEVKLAPWTVIDLPRFPYRGLLIDTSRHYLPLPVIKSVIDSMVYAKLPVIFALKPHLFLSLILRGVGYPSLWPSANCTQPLDVSNEFTFKLIDGILSGRISKTFSNLDSSIWVVMKLIQYFVLRAQKIALLHGYEIVNWLEIGVPECAVVAGLRCIVSNQDKWYLDHLDSTWDQFYMNEPLTNITQPKQQALGEHIDASDIQQTIWPQAAAAAERLWTTYDKLAKDPREVIGRLAHFKCLLNQRGIAAAPLAGYGRVAPEDPGSCYKQ